MGKTAQILLVMLTLLGTEARATVEASQYRQFWLWAGVRPQPVLQQADRLYLHQGEIGPLNPALPLRFQGQGIAPSKLPVGELWLAYRVERLDWDDTLLQNLQNQLTAWQRKGNEVRGIQIDFDASTHQLADYGHFLRQLRQQLPARYAISITGLLDWTRTGDIRELNALTGVVDELVVQTYRGRHTEPGYARYLQTLHRLTLPFKLGLAQGGEWDPAWEARLAQVPAYGGAVVFLINPPPP
ncbi:DUF3142 domain-containing protein [Aeromonas salmonicida]|uniref:DUF3142 domain-containing protein n=1 Tax=Escherichia coli TaxID=562 RepID=A0A3L0W1P7_ECOLX|nr:DUF3142 domain-containing protein [Aeromonas salmonicida]MDR6996899.1 hypothetical protein [Aeromonas salmonicida]MDR7021391.1 hypothetical protein [Aeromonas salmonicida]